MKCIWSEFFLHNFIVQYVNISIENIKVLSNKNLVMFLVLKTAQFLSRNGEETGTNLYCAISSRDVLLWTELITTGFWGKTTCRAILNWMISLNLQMTMRISILCVANTWRVILQSCSLVHNTMSSGHFSWAIRRPFLRAKRHIFRCYKIANFFKHGSNFGIVSWKCWTFKIIEKLISLHVHFKYCLKYVSKPFLYIITMENSHAKLRTPTSEFTVYCDTCTLTSLQSSVSIPLHPPLGSLKINPIWRLHYHLWTVISSFFGPKNFKVGQILASAKLNILVIT